VRARARALARAKHVNKKTFYYKSFFGIHSKIYFSNINLDLFIYLFKLANIQTLRLLA